jgi:hypothetical protein
MTRSSNNRGKHAVAMIVDFCFPWNMHLNIAGAHLRPIIRNVFILFMLQISMVVGSSTCFAVTLTSTPQKYSNQTSGTIDFTDSGTPSFECRLDSNIFSVCESPFNFSGLANGLHTVTVRATDGANISTASYDWVINTALASNSDVSPQLDTWSWRNPVPNGNGFLGMTFGNGLYVGVGGAGRIATSTDGATWTEQSSGTTMNLNDVVYSGTKFIAVGDGGIVLTSQDAITWIVRNSEQNTILRGIACSSEICVVVGYQGDSNAYGSAVTYTSIDYVNWSMHAQKPDVLGYGRQVIYANNMFIAAVNGGVYTSIDGLDWSYKSKPSGLLDMIAYGNGKYVSSSRSGGCYYSSDLVTWNSLGIYANYIYYRNGLFFAMGNNSLHVSTDAISWTIIFDAFMGPIPFPFDSFYSIAYGPNGYSLSSGFGGTYTSSDGYVWADRTPSQTIKGFWSDIIYGDGKYINNQSISSNDGITWTMGINTSFSTLSTVYANSKYVSVASDYAASKTGIATSSDGIQWTFVLDGINLSMFPNIAPYPNHEMAGIVYADNKFVAVSNSGVHVSNDAVTWTTITSMANKNLTGIAYGNGRFMAVGTGSAYMSYDGVDWMPGGETTAKMSKIVFGNNRFVAVGTDNSMSNMRALVFTGDTTADTTVAPQSIYSKSAMLFSVAYSESAGQFIAVGEGLNSKKGLILTSADGITWTEQNSPSYNPLYNVYCKDSQCIATGDMGSILTSGVLTPVNGVCGNDHGKSLSMTPTDLCTQGAASSVVGTGPWSWTCKGVYTGTDINCGASIQKYRLTVTVPDATGKGDVVADIVSNDEQPIIIFCPKGSCLANFNFGRTVKLTAIPDPVSIFTSWSGEECISNPCDIAMTGTKTVIANFTRDFIYKNYNQNAANDSLAVLMTTVLPGDEIRMLATEVALGSFTLNKAVTLSGGWKALHLSLADERTILNSTLIIEDAASAIINTTVKGTINVKSGKLTVNEVILR